MTFRQIQEKAKMPFEVHITRGSLTESVHLVDAVVLDQSGAPIAEFGRGGAAVTFPRSAVKFLQAVSFVESGAFDAFDLTERHLSLACASHLGEQVHTELVLHWLGEIGCREEDLVCGAHLPFHEQTAHELLRAGGVPGKRHNNCSGKHVGFLSTLKHLGWDFRHYGSYDHPLQIRLRQFLSELSGEALHQGPWGVDGCGIPTYAMSLSALAQSMLHFLPGHRSYAEREEAFRVIGDSLWEEPFLVGGSQDFCSDLMAMAPGRILLKAGAEGLFAGVLLSQGVTFALKIQDGGGRAAKVAVGALLRHLNFLSEGELLKLASHLEPSIQNWAGDIVGKIFVPNARIG
jgi:L-asparaginase II